MAFPFQVLDEPIHGRSGKAQRTADANRLKLTARHEPIDGGAREGQPGGHFRQLQESFVVHDPPPSKDIWAQAGTSLCLVARSGIIILYPVHHTRSDTARGET